MLPKHLKNYQNIRDLPEEQKHINKYVIPQHIEINLCIIQAAIRMGMQLHFFFTLSSYWLTISSRSNCCTEYLCTFGRLQKYGYQLDKLNQEKNECWKPHLIIQLKKASFTIIRIKRQALVPD